MVGTINNIQISGYVAEHTYEQYDVVSVTTGHYPTYFVSTSGQHTGQMHGSYLSNATWKRFDDPDFNFSTVWTPTFQTSLAVDLKPKLAPYGDGYRQVSDASLFGNRLSYEVTFNGITNRELKSLVGLFEYKGGANFIKMDILPFMTGRKFLAKNWSHNYVGENANDLSVSMFEYISDLNNG